MRKELLLCQCGDPAHQLIIFFDEETHQVYVSFHLSPKRNIFKRLWNAFKYVFLKQRSIYGDFDEVVLTEEHVDKLQDVVNHLKQYNNKETKIPLIMIQSKYKS